MKTDLDYLDHIDPYEDEPVPPKTGKQKAGFSFDYEDGRERKVTTERNEKPMRPDSVVKSIRERMENFNHHRKNLNLYTQVCLALRELAHWKRIAAYKIAENQRLRDEIASLRANGKAGERDDA